MRFNLRQVDGRFTFPELTMDSTAAVAADGRGFQGGITSVTRERVTAVPDSSTLQGDFFGPAANAVGGSFSADMGARDSKYIGVFSADGD